MEAFLALLQKVEQMLGPKFRPTIYALLVVGVLLHPIDALNTLQANDKAHASGISDLHREQMELRKELKELKIIKEQIAWIYGYLKQNSKEE